jgi:hypothetical protein
MKEIYSFQPEAVEVFRVGDDTDLILRKNIEKQQMTDDEGKAYTVYACDERQVRYAGVLTAEEVQKDFDKWWDYAPPTPVPVPEEKKLEDRVKELEAQSTAMADQLTSTQMALCDVYEQVLSATSTATE